jgi:hypothetical protein
MMLSDRIVSVITYTVHLTAYTPVGWNLLTTTGYEDQEYRDYP